MRQRDPIDDGFFSISLLRPRRVSFLINAVVTIFCLASARRLDDGIYLLRWGLPFRGRIRTRFHSQYTAFFFP